MITLMGILGEIVNYLDLLVILGLSWWGVKKILNRKQTIEPQVPIQENLKHTYRVQKEKNKELLNSESIYQKIKKKIIQIRLQVQ